MAPAVVKRRGGTEAFDDRKFYTSIFLTCMEVEGLDEDRCDEIASEVTDRVEERVEDREEVLSVELRMWGRNELKEFDEELAERFYTHYYEE